MGKDEHTKTKERVSFVADMDEVMTKYISNKFNMEQINEVINSEYIVHSFSTTDS